ncbi:protein HsdA [Acinetobacter nosocomialis]|uniref:restriction endonuclease subunit S n=1 Tax=Acinetobacter TaxID=469 RepID=UPI000D0ADBCE|nr:MULTISPECIES: restriction endonuclease subunit S [Acinetobacter]MCU4382079.1 restriction endonuclease subunit S [Acinetobacter ursingii]PSE97326.1 protein HsdA [Acinetobacter nosocomialis]
MSIVWDTYRIEDIAEKITIGPFGSRMKSDAYVESGVPVIRGTNLTGSKNFSGDWVFITEKLAKQLESCCVSKGDLVFPHRGAIGEVGIVDSQFPQYMMSSSLMKLRCNPSIADSEFIYYFFKSYQGRYELLKNASQVGTPGIGQPLTSLKNIELKLPSLGEQKRIAKILSDLDDKIHLNDQINQTLESIAQAIFKSWFIDFEPVRAKIAAKQEGKDPELAAMCVISGKSEEELKQMAKEDFAELQATVALFPDELVESELGEVPRGWEVSTIGKRFNVVMGQSPKGDTYNGNKHGKLFFQGRAEFGWRYPTPRLYTTDPKRVAKENDILMSVRAPVGDMNVAMEECCIGRGLSALSHRSGSFSYSYYCLKALQSKFNVFNGEGTVFGSINQNDLKNISFIEPINELIDLFAKTINKYDQRIKLNSFNTKSLIDVRDTLLPQLLSGEVDVSDLQGEGVL